MMKKPFVSLAASFATLALFALLGTAQNAQASQLSIEDPWVRPVMKGQDTVAYVYLRNDTVDRVNLTGASSMVADSAQINETMVQENGVLLTRPIAQISFGTSQGIALQPRGLHIALKEIKATFKPGDVLPVTLLYGDGTKQTFQAVVR